jgi:hypothetical protein
MLKIFERFTLPLTPLHQGRGKKFVAPAKAGAQKATSVLTRPPWIPAFAGMTQQSVFPSPLMGEG